jgi:Domain of Unknown Function (DUF1080)
MTQELKMKTAARWLATLPGALIVLGLVAELPGGCAGGGAASDGDDGAGGSNWGSGSDASSEASSEGDVGTGVDSTTVIDAGTGVDSAMGVDAEAGGDDADANDADGVGDDSATSNDAGSIVAFGATCPTGTTFTEPFTADPVASGTFAPLIGPYTYNSASSTLSLTAGNPNTQMWIGARDSWTNYTITAQIRIDSTGGNGGITFRMESVPTSPANNAGQMYYAGIATNQAILGLENGSWTEFEGPTATFTVGTFYTLVVVANGGSLSMSVDGTSYATNYTDSTFSVGSIGLRTYASGMTFGAISVVCN